MNEKSRSTWSIVLKTVIAVLTAFVGAMGFTSCVPTFIPINV